jgi:hypothetical protein
MASCVQEVCVRWAIAVGRFERDVCTMEKEARRKEKGERRYILWKKM